MMVRMLIGEAPHKIKKQKKREMQLEEMNKVINLHKQPF